VVRERVERELLILQEGGLVAEYFDGDRDTVVYQGLPTAGAAKGLPAITDVIVPVPDGYPGALIDLAGLPIDSPLFAHVAGGQNSQGELTVDGRQWRLASYHPHNGGGGPAWDQTRHGFHTYVDHLISWLERLT
jgi:hypothetical protein